MKLQGRTLGYALTVLGGLFWAVGGVCGQALFDADGVTSDWLVPVRLVVSGLIMLAIAAVRRQPVLAVWKNRRDALALLVFGIFGSAVCQYGYYTCIQYSNAAFSTVLSYTSPVFILAWTVLRARRAPRLYEIASVVLVLAGAVVCATHGHLDSLSVAPAALVWGVIGAVGFAVYTVEPQRLLKTYSLPAVIGWGMVVGGVLLSALCRPWTADVSFSASLAARMAVVIVVGTVLSFSCFQAGVRIVGGLAGSVLSSVEPVASVVLSAVFLHVQFLPVDLLGFALILATIPLIAVGDSRHPAALPPHKAA